MLPKEDYPIIKIMCFEEGYQGVELARSGKALSVEVVEQKLCAFGLFGGGGLGGG